jgi:hypothetical protein
VLRFSGDTRDFWLDGTDADAPAAPTGLTAELSGGGMGRLDRNMVYLTWDLPAPRGDIAGWVLYRDTASDPATVEDEVHLWADRERFEALNAYFDVVPGPGRYYYRIAAKDLKGNVGPYSDQVVVDVTDSESPLRNPGFEMESRLYKDATNQYYADRTWGDQWPLPAILGGSQVRPHAGRYAGLINGDGAHAANAFLDKFFFMQNVPGTAQTYHVGAYVRVDKIWRRGIIYDPNFWISEGLHVAVVGGNGEFWNERYADVVVSPTTLEGWEGDGQWHYVYGNVPATSEAVNIIVKMNGEGDHDPIEPLADAFVDDIVFTPIDQVPPVALVSADAVVAGTGQAVQLNASKSFAFDGNGEPLAPNTGLNYRWEFGDGTSAATAAPEVIYQMPGEYVARVTVTDQSGRQATAQVFVNVSGTQPAVSKTASPAVASSEERVTFSIELFGTGQEVMVEDPLPAEFAYLSAVTTCPSPGPSYDEQTRTVVYTGTPPAGESCRIDIETRVNGTEVESVVNTAFINYGGTLQLSASAEVILDAASVYLPFLGNGS